MKRKVGTMIEHLEDSICTIYTFYTANIFNNRLEDLFVRASEKRRHLLARHVEIFRGKIDMAGSVPRDEVGHRHELLLPREKPLRATLFGFPLLLLEDFLVPCRDHRVEENLDAALVRPAAGRRDIALAADGNEHEVGPRSAVKPTEKRLDVAKTAAPLHVEIVDLPAKRLERRGIYARLGIAVVEPAPEKDSLRHSLCCG